ncbi:Flp pilus assembly protein CpaB [Granulicella sibirica]|uniref:Flp pilus assembly protein RcpC/CpaB n=1 Tax=Granulicella sibirica TaxID=2479048 RepID=A0A4Q0SXJ1_9BACT|nr:Flp pilus assembly protein CpaB [Granulicella sibirica]RXH54338.1 Flp pilus assembly protein RcpC/CpaB [Granulicella sibirica]
MIFRRLAFAMTVALVISAGCTYLLSRKIIASVARQQPDQRYVAPATPLSAGEVLKGQNLQIVNWPAAHPVAGSFSRIEDLAGRTLLYPVDKGQPITDKYVTVVGSGSGLAGKIPDGMRGVSLRSDEVIGVGGFLVPGSRLDVLLTYRSERIGEPITVTVLQDAVVLAAGHQVQPEPENKPSVATVVTLLLTPDEAQRAVLASTQGSIHFVLRSGSDRVKNQESPVLLSQLSGVSAPVSAPRTRSEKEIPVVRMGAPRGFVVETILGDKLSVETFPRPALQ